MWSHKRIGPGMQSFYECKRCFLIQKLTRMLCVHKITISLKWFFGIPTTYVLVEKYEIIIFSTQSNLRACTRICCLLAQ